MTSEEASVRLLRLPRRYRPVNLGLRLALNAAKPSSKSCVVMATAWAKPSASRYSSNEPS